MTDVRDILEALSPSKRALYVLERLQSQVEATERASSEPIAVVGLACRLPGGVNDAESFWTLLRDGVDAIGEVPPDRWDADILFELGQELGGFSPYQLG